MPGEALPSALLASRPDVCCLFKPNRIDTKRDRKGSELLVLLI